METRTIVIVDTASNRQVQVQTDATTFGELKAAVVAAGVNISDKDWLEGITKTSPQSDDSLLPTNVPYKGKVTNSLVYMLTNTNKKVRSGACVASRYEAYAYIKEHNLAADFKNLYGVNFTNGKTDTLVEFANEHIAHQNAAVAPATEQVPVVSEESTNKYTAVVEALAYLFVALDDTILSDVQAVVAQIKADMDSSTAQDIKYSSSEISAMFK